MELYTLVDHCDYRAMTDKMIRDRHVVGIWNVQLLQQLQIHAKLTREKAKKKICQWEAVAEQQQFLTGTGGEASGVDGVPSAADGRVKTVQSSTHGKT